MSFGNFARKRSRFSTCRKDAVVPARFHIGTQADFLRRHRQECSQYDRSTLAERTAFANDFLERITDTRNLMSAVEHLAASGEKSPGPNGQRLYYLLHERVRFVWQELRRLSHVILDCTYAPGPVRRVNVPKASGSGTRPIDVANWQDQVVQRAIVQILDPYLDSQFDELSMGYRLGHDRFEAIAKASVISEREGRQTWLCADLQDAFTRVPHAPLLNVVQCRVRNERVTRLISTIITANGRTRGIAQGGALSPLLLNLYLDHHLDRKWRKTENATPLIRVADDLLMLCCSAEEARQGLQKLQDLARPIGMVLNERKTQICNLEGWNTAEWLGFQHRSTGGKVCVQLCEDFYSKAERSLRDALAGADGVLRMDECVQGIFDQLGPCYQDVEHQSVICHVASLANRLGGAELLESEKWQTLWRRSSSRYQLYRRLGQLTECRRRSDNDGIGSGSARSQILPATLPASRDDGASVVPTSFSSTSSSAILTVTVAAPSQEAGWAYQIEFAGVRRIATKCELVKTPSRIRAALLGLLAGIREISRQVPIRVVTDSGYLCGEWRTYFDACCRRGCKTEAGQTPQNWDLLSTLDRVLNSRTLIHAPVVFEFRHPPR